MKLTRTYVVLPLAGLLVVAGAGAVLATTGPAPVTGSVDTVVPAAESPSPTAATGATTPVRPTDTALQEVLDDLVSKGTITESQKTAILDGVAAERTARREARQANRDQLRTFLADGVITQEEFNQLPADSPLRTMTGLMDDGKITLDELRSLGRGLGVGIGRGGMRGGGMFGGNGYGPAASPAPSTGTSG
jgi:polyhydroxyalkanoate synthesis regulator phasin